MAVAPDLLLSSASEVRPRTVASKAQRDPAESAGDKAASFAKVLADERQASSAGSRQADSRAGTEKPEGALTEKDTDVEAPASDEPQVADNGNPLPPSTDESLLDPLMLLGVPGNDTVAAAADEVPTLPIPAGELVIDAQLEELNSAAALQVTLEMAKKTEAEQAGKSALSVASGSAAAGAEAAVKALGGLKVDPEAGGELEAEPELEAFSLEVADQSLDSLKEAGSDTRLDNQAVRLGALGQAINPASAAPRTLVPGQPVAMQQGAWSEAVVDRVMWLSSQNLRSAEIQLDPAELGRLDVRISLNQDQTQITFSSPHAQVREALESQMYRMRELFAQQGVNQLDVNVSDQSLARNFQGESRGNGDSGSQGSDSDARLGEVAGEVANGETSVMRPATLRGLVDFYA